MLRKLLRAKIHRATVTKVDLEYEGSIAIDECLLKAAGLLPYEAVHIWNLNNGERLETYVITAPEGSGEICLNGAAARLAHSGDMVIIAAFSWMTSEEIAAHKANIVVVDGKNRITSQYQG